MAGADVISLQEMDEVGVERIARTMKLNYAYYPGSIHPIDDRYFGPALLSRWPIERSWKLILPHEGRLRHQQRTATGAILRIGNQRVLAYAVHLETQIKISDQGRRDQVQTILDDAAQIQRAHGHSRRLQQRRDRAISREKWLSLAHRAGRAQHHHVLLGPHLRSRAGAAVRRE